MNKKFKIVVPFAVLTLTCGISAGVLAGCNTHEHDYSSWKKDANEHVRVCPDDGAEDETTRGPHEFYGGVCDCGWEESAGKKFGTASGQIKLHKLGGYDTDYSGVTIDLGDDDVVTDYNAETGAFTIENAEVGKNYNLKISKPGYKDYTTIIKVSADKDTVIGGTTGAVLEYEVFGLLCDYDGNYHDFSNVNEEVPTLNFLENDGTKTLNVLSKDGYTDVSATLHLEFNNSGHNWRTQGVVLKFEDGKHVIVRLHNADQKNGNIQYAKELWNLGGDDTLFDTSNEAEWEWGEHKLRDLKDSETAAFKADGIDLTVVLKDGAIHTFLGGEYLESYELPDGYAEKKAHVGYFVFNAASNGTFGYEISETVPEEMNCTLSLDVEKPDGVDCTVTKSVDKNVFDFDETVELTFNSPDGYLLDSLIVAGEDRYGDVKDGKITLNTNRLNLDVQAVFGAVKEVALDLTVKGNKLGTTTPLAEGTTVAFKNTSHSFEVDANGKITADTIISGRYTLVVDGYFEKTVVINEGVTEVVLECDTFKEILHWGNFNFDNQNSETPEFGITNDCSVVLTNDTYGTVMGSIYLKGNNQNAGNGGLVFRFVGDGLADNGESVTITMQGTRKVQFSKDGLWGQTTVASGLEWKNLIYFENVFDDDFDRVADEHAQEYLDAYNAGTLKLSVVREGATFYVYLNGRFVGVQTVDAKYADAKCEVGFITASLGNTGDWKSWKVEITEDVPVRAGAALTDGTSDTNGTVAIPEGDKKVGDTVKVTVTPKAGYLVKKLTVGGVDVTASVSVDRATQVGTYNVELFGDTTVAAEFEAIVYGSLESSVSLRKTAAAATALADGTEVVFSNSKFYYEATVSNGKISLDLAQGTYTVGTEGSLDLTVTVTDEKYTTAIVFVYQQFTSSPASADLTQIYEGKVTATGNGGVDLETKDKYVDVTAEAKFDVPDLESRRYAIALVFDDGKNFRVDFCVHDNGNNILQETDWSSIMFKWDWVDFPEGYFAAGTNSYTDDEVRAEFMAKGLTYKLERQGETVKVYINGVLMKTYTLPDGYKDQSARLKFVFDSNGTDGTKGFTYSVNA